MIQIRINELYLINIDKCEIEALYPFKKIGEIALAIKLDYGEILFSLNNGDFILIDEKFKNRNIKHIFKDKEVKLKTFIKFNNITYVGIINSLKI